MKQNIQIYINDILVDIDQETAMGVNFTGFSTGNLGNINLSHTNSFTIPLTNHNHKAIGFVDNMNLNTKQVQSSWYGNHGFKMYADGLLVFTGKVYVDEITDGRINLYVVRDRDFVNILQSYTMWEATQTIVDVLNDELGELYGGNATWSNIVNFMATGVHTVWLPYVVGTLNKQYPYNKFDSEAQTHSCSNKYEDTDNDDLKERFNLNSENRLTTEVITNDTVVGDYKTGCIYVKLYNLITTVLGNLGWQVTFDSNVYTTLANQFIRMPDIVTYMDLTTYKFSFAANDSYHYKINDPAETSSKKISFLDLIKYICQEYCLLFNTEGNTVTFHSIQNITDTTTQHIKINKILTRNFYIPNVPQQSMITYEALGDGSTLTGGKEIISHNQNIEKGSESTVLFSIKRFLPGYFAYLYDDGQVQTNTYALNTVDPEYNKKFIVVQKAVTQTNYQVKVCRYFLGNEDAVYVRLYRAINRTVDELGYWDQFASMCEYPDRIIVTAILNPYEVNIFRPWNKMSFNTLPGEWLVESISEYNPRLDNPEVKITAVRLR